MQDSILTDAEKDALLKIPSEVEKDLNKKRNPEITFNWLIQKVLEEAKSQVEELFKWMWLEFEEIKITSKNTLKVIGVNKNELEKILDGVEIISDINLIIENK